MIFSLTSVIYIFVIIQIVLLSTKANHSSDDDEESLISRNYSITENSKRKSLRRRSSQSSQNKLEDKNHDTGSVRRSSLSYISCGFRIRSYLNGKKISSSIYDTVWYNFNYKTFWMNSYEDYKLKIIHHINLIRMKHGICPLQESEHLNGVSQIFATKMATHFYFNDKPFKKYGIIHTVLTRSDLTKVVSNWYTERHFYSYKLNYKIPIAKDFTQMIWKSSHFIGVGIEKRHKFYYIVVFFYPKGNIKDHFKTNVFEKEISWKRLAQLP